MASYQKNPGRGRPRIYGREKFSLAKRAGQRRGWQKVDCTIYGRVETKTIKTSWRPRRSSVA